MSGSGGSYTALSTLTERDFERPVQLGVTEGLATEVLEALRWEEDELAEAVQRTLKARDQLVQAWAGSESDVDLVALRVAIAEIAAAADHSQLTCGQIDVSGEAAHKNMAAREWKASLVARYTRLQKMLLRLSSVVTHLETSRDEVRPTPFHEYVANTKIDWSHQKVLQQKLDALRTSANMSVCNSYAAEAQAQGLEVIQEVFGFLASPAAQNHTLMLCSKALRPADVMVPLRLCATSSAMYGSLMSLYLCDCQLVDDHVSQLSTVLPELRNLELVALRDNSITCKGAAELSLALKRCKHLKKLWLDGNLIQARGAEALHLHRNLRGTVLEQISLSRNAVGDAGLRFMLLALMNPLRKTYLALEGRSQASQVVHRRRLSDSTLTTATSVRQSLSIGRKVRQVFVRLVAVHCFLAIRSRGRFTPVLQLQDMQLTSRSMDLLAHVLRENTSITALYLSKNNLRDQGAITLASALLHATNLKSLDIAYNGIGERGIEAVMRVADQSQSLESLDLSGNEITGTGLNWITSIGHTFYMDEAVLQGRQRKSDQQQAQAPGLKEQLLVFEQQQQLMQQQHQQHYWHDPAYLAPPIHHQRALRPDEFDML